MAFDVSYELLSLSAQMLIKEIYRGSEQKSLTVSKIKSCYCSRKAFIKFEMYYAKYHSPSPSGKAWDIRKRMSGEEGLASCSSHEGGSTTIATQG